MKITGGRGADSAIEALGTQATFESALRSIKPGGTLSSLGVYSGDLKIPLSAFAAGLGDHKIQHRAVPRRQGAHAPPDERAGRPTGWTWACWSPTSTSSTTSWPRTTCLPPARWRAEGAIKPQ